MKFSAIFSRPKLVMAILCGFVSGSAHAVLDTGSLFFIATDASRGGVSESYILDLQSNYLTDDLSGFGGLTDAGLAAWLNDPAASSLITWGVFGAGRTNGAASEFSIASTVNQNHGVPATLQSNKLQAAVGRGRAVASGFNDNAIGNNLEAAQGEDGFPLGFGDDWNDGVDFSATGGLDEVLPMYIFGIQEVNPFAPVAPIELDGLWSLNSASGSLEFAPVPLPAAIWMFAAGIAGLFVRRRGAI